MPKKPHPNNGASPDDPDAGAPAVEKPIINSPYSEPGQHWKIHPHEPPELVEERRPPTYFYSDGTGREKGELIDISLVGKIRERLAKWRPHALRGEGGVTRVTMELLNHWRREGRQMPLFFAQLEAVETIIFLNEARADFLQGINIPQDKPPQKDLRAFDRKCCKMATGSGKTMVMAMLAAWSILNKVNNRQAKRFSDAVLIVCPNVTIRDRLAELDPLLGEASIYQTRDLVPKTLMPQLRQGKVLVTNWHNFEPQASPHRMTKIGKRVVTCETIRIGNRTHTARGTRYMTEEELRWQANVGRLAIIGENKDDASGALQSAQVESVKYIESDRALVDRLLKRTFGGQQNILVFNDEAHHAYRLQSEKNKSLFEEEEDAEYYRKQATVWVEGLDKIHSQRGINQCIDFSATPYFLQRAGKSTGRIFPWTVSNFGLEDAIESGLVKIPQLAARDNTGAEVPGYFNIWNWIREQLSTVERGGRRTEPNPEAVLRYAHIPLAMLGGRWEETRRQWEKDGEQRPPVYIIVCKTTQLAKVMYEWLAEDKPPNVNIPSAQMPSLVNKDGKQNTIRVDSKVKEEVASGNSRDDEARWMRHTLDTIGETAWRKDSQGKNIHPEGFAELVEKLAGKDSTYRRFLAYPPGRDVRCIVSVGMLTEGWDCNTVTHIIGLRPFMSQLLCEQVIGRGLRRASYSDFQEDSDLLSEEIATVLGVPLTSFPVKTTGGNRIERVKKHHIYALPKRRKEFEITFPRVEGYYQHIRHRVTCDMEEVAPLDVDGTKVAVQVDVTAALLDTSGMPSIQGPGEDITLTLDDFRKRFRMQKGMFDLTRRLVDHFLREDSTTITAGVLFRQIYQIIDVYLGKR